MTENERKEFVKIIREIVQQEIAKIPNLEYSFFGIVDAANGSGFDVIVPGTESQYHALLNKSGETLTAGDAVILRAKDKNMGNAYIAVKCG